MLTYLFKCYSNQNQIIWQLKVKVHSDLCYIFPAKNHVSFVDILCTRKSSNFSPSIKRLWITKEKKHNQIILHLHVIIPWPYKRSRNQAVVMFQSRSSKNAIACRFCCHFLTITRLARGTTQWQDVHLRVTNFEDHFLTAIISARRSIGIRR